MQILVFSDTKIEGPAAFKKKLPQPQIRKGYYRDIAVIAFPTPENDAYRLFNIHYKAGFQSTYGLLPKVSGVPQNAVIKFDSIIDISEKMDDQGNLEWQVPQGNWTILRVGHTPTGKNNHPSPDSGLGLECDKLSREALDKFWEGGIKPIIDKLGPLMGKTVNNLLIDSYEVGCNNWTRKMRSEFKQRRGYDLFKYFPAISGRIVESELVTEKFLWDFRRTIADLFADNYFSYFSQKCKENGLLSSVEPYMGPFENLEVAAEADIVMGEFWASSFNTLSGFPADKLAASVGHVYGKKYVGAESFTAAPYAGKWQNHPGGLKSIGEMLWCTGINRFIFHRYAHQPWMDRLPGMTMGQWGTHFDRTNTWWGMSKPWMKYLARSQYLLQEGQFAADILAFNGQAIPNDNFYSPELKNSGYDYDSIGTKLIFDASVKDGKIVLPSGMVYRLLLVLDGKFMTPAILGKIKQLINDGAVVISDKPQLSPSLEGYPASDVKIKTVANEIWGEGDGTAVDKTYGRGTIISGKKPQQVLSKMGIDPDFRPLSENPEISFIHRTYDSTDVYFVACFKNSVSTVDCSFRVTGKKPQLWDPVTGKITEAALWRMEDDRTIVTLTFEPTGSVFVVFDENVDKNIDTYVGIEAEVAADFGPKIDQGKLKIIKAQYGVFTKPRMVDVTEKLSKMVSDNELRVYASNNIAGDPAAAVVKKLFVKYQYGNVVKSIVVNESNTLKIPSDDDKSADKQLEILSAAYGDLPGIMTGLPKLVSIDISDELSKQIKDSSISVKMTNVIAGKDPVPGYPKILKLVYSFGEVVETININENNHLQIPKNLWRPVPFSASLDTDGGKAHLSVWQPGNYKVTKALGKNVSLEVKTMPKPFQVKGPWELNFPAGWSAPERVTLSKLISWTNHPHDGIKYFSGTAIYKKSFDLPGDFDKKTGPIVLDLGQVKFLARVKLNGKNLGVLWKYPFRLDISDVVKKGSNRLEIEVVNLWPNRLIGDEQFFDDCQWTNKSMVDWPDWFVKNEPRPSKNRRTFTTWKHWNKDDPVITSGLLGPVTIRQGKILSLRSD